MLLTSLCMVGISVWTLIDKNSFACLFGSNLYISSAYVSIAASLVLICFCVISFLATYREVRCLLLFISVFIFLIFIVQFMAAVIAFVFRPHIERTMEPEMQSTILDGYGIMPTYTEAWDRVQTKFQCCASDSNYNLTRWMQSKWFEQESEPRPYVPASCCKINEQTNEYISLELCQNLKKLNTWPDAKFTFLKPCYHPLKDYVQKDALVLAFGGVVNSVVMIISILLVCILRQRIDH